MKTNLFLLLLLFPVLVCAIQGDVELSLKQDSELWISQKIVARLIVKTDAYSITDLRVDIQASDDVIIIKPESAAFKESKTIDGVQWQNTVYEYIIYPMRAGEISLNPFKVEFSASMGYGQPKQTFNLDTRPATLQVARPEGMSVDSFVLTTNKLELAVTYTPDVDKLKVGDAFERKIVITAEDVPDILLQPVPVYAPQTLDEHAPFKFYRSEPVLFEKKSTKQESQGKTLATRIETDTFVASVESDATIPEIVMYWWDPQQRIVHTEKIPAKSLTIMPNPLVNRIDAVQDSQAGAGFSKITAKMYWLFSFVVLLAMTAWWLWPGLKQKLALRKQRFEASEAGHFKRFAKACSDGKPETIYQYFYSWARQAMPQVSPLNFKQIAQQYQPLKASLESLESALMNDPDQFDARLFRDQVSNLRQTILIQQTRSNYELIRSINPGYWHG